MKGSETGGRKFREVSLPLQAKALALWYKRKAKEA